MMKIEEILRFLDERQIEYSFQGDESVEVEGYSSLKNYKKNTFTWAKNEKAYEFGFQGKLLVIAQEGLTVDAENVIYSRESKLAFFSLIEYVATQASEDSESKECVGTGTVIGPGVRLGKNVRIGANCVLQGKITVGDNTRIWNNVTILNHVSIGEDCEIQSGCVIGHDGFAWNENEAHEKTMIKHFGGIEIEDKVYIGPNCVIDRGEIDNTLIRTGAKIDANCFLAHNVVVGRNVILITGSKLYGSSDIGDNAYIASATVRNQCKVGAGAFVGIGSVVIKDVPEHVVVTGVPARIMKKGE